MIIKKSVFSLLMNLWRLLCYVKLSSTNSLLKASLGRDSVKIYILTVVTVGYSNTRGFPYCKSFLWITSLVFPRIACLIITVEPLSTTASFFGGQSVHWLMFKPLYNSQFLLSQRGHWGKVQLYLLKSSSRILIHPCRVSFSTCDSKHQRFALDSFNGRPTGHRCRILD